MSTHLSSSDLDVERLMHEIRRNVKPVSESLPQTTTTPAYNGALHLQPTFETKRDNHYHVNDLLRFHGEDFVRNAYAALLQREPDDAGLNYHMQSLATGRFNKIDVLASLHNSPEGRRSGVTLAGLSTPATIRRLGRIPIVGYIIRLFIAILRLPSFVQHQNQFEHYSLSLHQRTVDHQNQNQRDLTTSVKQLATEMLDTVQTITKQQQAIELALRQRDELAAWHTELAKTTAARFNETRQYVDDLSQQQRELREQQQAISLRHEAERNDLLGQQQQLRSDLDQQITNQQQQLRSEFDAGLTKQQQLTTEIDTRMQELRARQQRAHDELAAQEARLRVLLEEVNRNAEATPNSSFVQVASEESDHLLDGLYASFEDQFRGKRDEVRRRLEVYIPILKEAHITGDVLDIGCGRGEWLELLESEGIKGQGLDRNRVFIDECRRAGLSVIEGDALTHLRSLPAESLSAVTSFHLVEHLPFEMLIHMLDEMVRTLRHGGLLILETPNPENLLVGGCNFYADPTHRNPIPSETLQFLLEARGLHDIRVLKLRPWDEARIEGDSEIVKRFNDLFYSAPDYGIIATRT